MFDKSGWYRCWWFLLSFASIVGRANAQEDWPSTTTGIAVLATVSVVVAGLAAGIIYAICRETGCCNESKVAPTKVEREARRPVKGSKPVAERAATRNEPYSAKTEAVSSERPVPVQNGAYSTGTMQAEVQSTNFASKPYGGYDDRGNIVGLRVV